MYLLSPSGKEGKLGERCVWESLQVLEAGGSLFCSELPPSPHHIFSPKVIRSLGKIFILFKHKCSPFLCREDICHELLALVVPGALTPVHSYLQLPSVTKNYEHK